jgi:hypothetical protein
MDVMVKGTAVPFRQYEDLHALPRESTGLPATTCSLIFIPHGPERYCKRRMFDRWPRAFAIRPSSQRVEKVSVLDGQRRDMLHPK